MPMTKLEKFILAQNMAFMISVPPSSNLEKLLIFCLATTARKNTPFTTILQLTYDLMENPSNLASWAQEVMGHDLDYSQEEWLALGAMDIKNSEEFMASVWQDLEKMTL